MSARGRYLLTVAARGRDPLPALAATLLVLLGVYAYRPNAVGSTLGLTALAALGLCCWLVAAVLRAEPGPQADAVTVALGGPAARRRMEAGLIAAVALAIAALFVFYPVLLGLFDRPVEAGDLAAGALAHWTSGALGGAIGALFAAPRVQRAASQATACTAAVIAVLALPGPLGPVAGAAALDGAAPGHLGGALLAACAGTLALLAAVRALEALWQRRLG